MPSIILDRDLATLAARQYGVLSAEQLRNASISRAGIRHRVEAGVLAPIIGDTYLVAGAPDTAAARYRAATLAVRGSVIAVRAAAQLHAFPAAEPARPEVMVTTSRGHRIEGVTVRRRDDLLDRHRTVVGRIPVTTVPRTVLDLAAYVDRWALAATVDALCDARRLSIRTLFDEFDLIARRGRDGTATMRWILEPRLASLTMDRSELERRGLAFLRRHGFPTPEVEFRPPWAGPTVARVDLAYPDLQLVIELDGRKWHDRSDRFESDRLRDQLAMAHGWIVVRITWRQLHEDPDGVASRLRATLRSRSLGRS
jgi:predicted transcriptional regulator of viral defense system